MSAEKIGQNLDTNALGSLAPQFHIDRIGDESYTRRHKVNAPWTENEENMGSKCEDHVALYILRLRWPLTKGMFYMQVQVLQIVSVLNECWYPSRSLPMLQMLSIKYVEK